MRDASTPLTVAQATAAVARAQDLPALLEALLALCVALPGIDADATCVITEHDAASLHAAPASPRWLQTGLIADRSAYRVELREGVAETLLAVMLIAPLDSGHRSHVEVAGQLVHALGSKAATELLARHRGERHLDGLRDAPSLELLASGPQLEIEFLTHETSRLLDTSEGHGLSESLPTSEAQGLLSLAEHVTRTGRPFLGTQVRIHGLPGNGGELAYYNLAVKPWLDLRGGSGEQLGLLIQGVNVTELVQARQAYEAMNARLRELVDTVDAVVWELDPQRRSFNFVAGWSHRYGRGWTHNLEPELALEVAHPEDRDKLRQAVERAAFCDESVEISVRVQVAPRRGAPIEQRWFHVRMHRIDASAEGAGVVIRGVTVDITERVQAERMVARARQQQSLSMLARGAAHDFNNMLGAAALHIDEAMRLATQAPSLEGAAREQVREQAHHHMQVVSASLGRATQLTRRLQVFAGDAKPERVEIVLADELAAMQAMLASLLPPDVSLELEFGEAGTITVLADPSQLQQVLMNLVINAGQASKERGGVVRLRLRTASQEQAVGACAAGGHPEGPLVCIEVQDEGEGFAAGNVERAFDPFWSTRGPGRGLGLAIVAGVLRSHAWSVLVDSAPGRGTCFRIFAPIHGRRVLAHPEQRGPAPVPGPATPRLLLVEDEAVIRFLLTDELEAAGFAVTETDRASLALAEFERAPCPRETWAGAFVDLQLPDEPGELVIQALRRRDPELPIVIMTGRCDDDVHAMAARLGAEVLCKPFGTEQIPPLLRGLRYTKESQ
ncbi:response regulator [Pseudenhygromyxa sp. WMMC2535]|uniref:ATP-binding protein n=1 Tax=Pseudenhygromyxa sp. WMMC2535 TaxID=2712867 RepID=UPI001557704A|nr:ATP-binding protein [Pseudenhygromyxa sp. WMMC2535]NVB41750.1 response regulator [Pseudenhygromyxa sp. WMMC2535]